MRREISRFFAALRFFTRFPVPAWVGHDQEELDHAARYFPLVGGLVGLFGALFTWLPAIFLPLPLAVALGMTATILATGAFHEDGLADSCDGFGGGWDREQVLTIMKDSRIGSYGAIGIGMMLLSKWNALLALGALLLPALLAAHALSRTAAVAFIYTLDYVRETASRVKPLSRRIRGPEFLLACAFGLLPCLLLPWQLVLPALALLSLTALLFGLYCRRRIGGYTGDVLGACQQLSELAFYVGLLGAIRVYPMA